MSGRAAVVVPTLNAGAVWKDSIRALLATGINANDVYIIDSGSTDNTVTSSKEAGFQVLQIERTSFNHGGTRQLAVAALECYDFVVFFTQDAILCNKTSLNAIIEPFKNDDVAAVCGRQVPRKGANAIEAHARLYNYPDKSVERSIEDIGVYGLKTAFISNSFAAYRISMLNKVGGFPGNVIFGEDMFVAAKLLKANYKIAYAAGACVYHSHAYSFRQEFKRYFDMGVFHSRESWIRQDFGGAEGEGVKFLTSEFHYLMMHACWRIPESLLRTILRYAGFRTGLMEKKLPLTLKRVLAMNKLYFS